MGDKQRNTVSESTNKRQLRYKFATLEYPDMLRAALRHDLVEDGDAGIDLPKLVNRVLRRAEDRECQRELFNTVMEYKVNEDNPF